MSFKDQGNFKDLQRKIALSGQPVTMFVGAGLSAPARIPTWEKLLSLICEEWRSEFKDLNRKGLLAVESALLNKNDLWCAFDILNLYDEVKLTRSIQRIFNDFEGCEIPSNYLRIWDLNPRGVVTLNIDDLCRRSFVEVYGSCHFHNFDNLMLSDYVDVNSRSNQFVCNLHGSIGNAASWIFTSSQFKNLQSSQSYKHFLGACFLSSSVVFVGISANDIAASGVLAEIANTSNAGDHYWITADLENENRKWANKNAIKIISYDPRDNHNELADLLESLKAEPELDLPSVVRPKGRKERNFAIKSPREIEALGSANEKRIELNKIALQLTDRGDFSASKYESFIEDYEEAIHSAWYIPKKGNVQFFDYSVVRVISNGGAFGSVYEVKKGEDSFALKVLHEGIREEAKMMQSFRRGVESMGILAEKEVVGMVPLVEAWELPAALVMDFVPGIDLGDAVEGKYIDDWKSILTVGYNLCQILESGHKLKEVVIHRDVRPPNVMLRDFYCGGDEIEVVLTDFDLSWHSEAMGKSVDLKTNVHGYLAPEQYQKTGKNYSRSALVDSYGFAMTLYYMCSGLHPAYEENRRPEWRKSLYDLLSKRSCSLWKSLPRRVSEMIYDSTSVRQDERRSMNQMAKEMKLMLGLLKSGCIPLSDSMLLEEIAINVPTLNDRYVMSESCAACQFRSATGLTLKLSIEGGNLILNIEWRNDADTHYDSVKKYVERSSNQVSSLMNKYDFSAIEILPRFDGIEISGHLKSVRKLFKEVHDVSAMSEKIEEILKSVIYKG